MGPPRPAASPPGSPRPAVCSCSRTPQLSEAGAHPLAGAASVIIQPRLHAVSTQCPRG